MVDPAEGASPARLYAACIGAGLVLFGIAGFFYGSSFGSPGRVEEAFGIFAVNGWLNVFHIAVGALGLLAAGSASRRYALLAGALLLGAGIWGILLGSGEAILSLFPVDGAENLLHIALGALGLAAALGTPAHAGSTAPAT